MISEVEKIHLKKEMEEFKKGIRHHIYAIQEYINIWARGGETEMMSKMHLNVADKIERLVMDAVYVTKENEAQDDKKDAQNPFFNAILRRFYKKINKL